LIQHPLGLLGLAALGGSAEACLGRTRRAIAAFLALRAGAAVRWAGFSLAAAVVISLLASLVLPYPQLDLEPKQPLLLGDFLTRVLVTMATMFRLRDPNFLLFSTFWGGFGWLDTMPDSIFLSAFALLSAVGLIIVLLHIARTQDVRRFVWLVALGLGSMIALVVYALSIYRLPMALQGRYLIGWYLPVLSVIASAAILAEPSAARPGHGLRAITARVPRPVALLGLSGLVHTYCLGFILRRYF
jgi:hypothetical protein